MRKENTKGTQLVIYTMQNLINMKEVTRKFKRPLSIHRKMRYKDMINFDIKKIAIFQKILTMHLSKFKECDFLGAGENTEMYIFFA